MAASIAASLCLALAACEADTADSDRVVVRHRAGVTIVENPGDLWSTPERWTVADTPSVRIGAVEGEAPYLFGSVRSIVPLSDGRIVVADAGDQTLRWFDESGTFLFERGGTGGGPGEFERITDVTRAADDTLVVTDPTLMRVTAFAPDGSLAGTTDVRALGSRPERMFRLDDGSFITALFAAADIDRQVGIDTIRVPIVHLSSDGSRVDTVGIFDVAEVEIVLRDGRLRMATGYFQQPLVYLASSEIVYVGSLHRFAIDVYSPAGELVRSIRGPGVDLTLTRAHRDSFRAFMLDRVADRPAEVRARLEAQFDETYSQGYFPESTPAYSTFMLDPDGNLWVGEYRPELNLRPPGQWLVFDAEGRLLSSIEMPVGFTLLAVYGKRVYGWIDDDLGVRYVLAYDVDR